MWDGENLTYYGLFNANAYALAVMIAFFLLASIGISLLTIIIMTLCLLTICMPSSKILAQIVEKRPHVFSVGAASFMGIILTINLKNQQCQKQMDKIPKLVLYEVGGMSMFLLTF